MTTLFKAPTSPANASYVTMAIQGKWWVVLLIQSQLDSLGYVAAKKLEMADEPREVVAFYDVAVKELSQFESDYQYAKKGL